jgi:hypothetical protein
MQTDDIKIHASSQEALELACEALEFRYGTRVQLYRFCDTTGEWYAWGTIRTLAPRRHAHPMNRPGHRRIIIS